MRWHDLPPRVLVRTCERAPTAWSDDFTAFAPETIELAGRPRRAAGRHRQRSRSTRPTARRWTATSCCSRHDLRVLENLVLDDVPAGDYELIALPLK